MKRFNDKTLILLNIIMIVNTILMYMDSNFIKIKYVTLVLIFFVVLFAKEDNYIPLIMYMHPNSALYDDINFKYLFNFTIFIIAIKMIINKRYFLPKKATLFFLLIVCWEFILDTVNYDVEARYLSLVSWISSYLILIFMSNKKESINFEKIYKYFFSGFVLAALAGLSEPIKKWGVNFSIGYRFTGLLRDPNYYSIDAIFLMFSSYKYTKEKKLNIYIIIVFVLGILSISKMFIIIVVLGFLLNFMFMIVERKMYSTTKLLLALLIVIASIPIIIKTNLISTVFEKYLYRTETTTTFTGRDYLMSYYINTLVSNPKNLLIGNGFLKYSYALGVGDSEGKEFFTNMVAHNTYLDIILSWGLLGSCVYLLFIKEIVSQYSKNLNIVKANNLLDHANILILLFLVALLVLSYLSLDVFAILMLYLIILKYC